MGLFGNNYNKIEKGLLEHYSQMFAMMGIPDASKMARDMLKRSIERSKKEGTYNLPPNFGDIILEKEKAEDPAVEKMAKIFRDLLPKKRAEGVKDEDIRWWWNLNDVERNIMLSFDEMSRMALLIKCVQEDGLSDKQAAEKVWRFHPTYTYGDPSIKPEKAPIGLQKEDYKLPIELKDRVNIFIEKRAQTDPEKYKKETEESSTFNALIRKEIRKGNI